MSTVIQDIESSQLRKGLPSFSPGDRVRVHFLVIEGNRKRPQVFEGVVIKRQGSGVRETFTVRKVSFGVGVERTFPLHSPKIEKLEVASRGRVRRAKLYYLRDRVGKAARVTERRWGIDEDVVGASAGAMDASGEAQESIEETPVDETGDGPEASGSEAAEPAEPEGAEADGTPGTDGSEAKTEAAVEPVDDAKQATDADAAPETEEASGDETAGATSDAGGDSTEDADKDEKEEA